MAEIALTALYGPVVYVVETICALTVFGVGAWEVAGHRTSLGALLSFAILLTFIYPQVQTLSGYRLTVAESQASAARVAEILDVRQAVADGDAVAARVRSRGRIDFAGVGFRYPEADADTLDGLEFTAMPGQVLRHREATGAGKSTVARLLLRFYDPDRGSIRLDGVDIRELSLRTLRYNITLLQQENQLIDGTIGENIGYGRRGSTAARSRPRPAPPERAVHSRPSRTATTPRRPARPAAVRRSAAADSPSPAPCCGMRPCWCWTTATGPDPAAVRQLTGLLFALGPGRTLIVITHDLALAAAADDVLLVGPPAVRPPGPRAGGLLARWCARPEGGSLKIQNFESRFIELAHMRRRKFLQ